MRRYGSFCLLILVTGCSGTSSVQHAEVTGRVLFKGEPLPGGRLVFVATHGGFANTSTIGEDGSYKIKAPVGEVHIAVDNRMLQPRVARAPAPAKRTGESFNPVTGTYVPIPSKYYEPDQSGLVYTVRKGEQTYDIPLEEAPTAPVP
jgi:hypothetical protein